LLHYIIVIQGDSE